MLYTIVLYVFAGLLAGNGAAGRVFNCQNIVVPQGVAYLDTRLKHPAVRTYDFASGAACTLPADASACDIARLFYNTVCTNDQHAVQLMTTAFPLLVSRPTTLPFKELWSPQIADVVLLLAAVVTTSLCVLVSLKDVFV